MGTLGTRYSVDRGRRGGGHILCTLGTHYWETRYSVDEMGTMSTRYVRSFSSILLFVSLLFHDYKKYYKKWWYKTEILKFEVVPDQLKNWKPSQQDRKVVAFQHDTSEQGYSPDPSDSSSLGLKGLESRQCQRHDTIGCTLLPERGAVTSVFFAPPANHNTL